MEVWINKIRERSTRKSGVQVLSISPSRGTRELTRRIRKQREVVVEVQS